MPHHQPMLGSSFIVMLLENVHPRSGYLNWALRVVEHMTRNMLFLRSVSERGTRKCLVPLRILYDAGYEEFHLVASHGTQVLVRI